METIYGSIADIPLTWPLSAKRRELLQRVYGDDYGDHINPDDIRTEPVALLIETKISPKIESKRPVLEIKRPVLESKHAVIESQHAVIEGDRVETKSTVLENKSPVIDLQTKLYPLFIPGVQHPEWHDYHPDWDTIVYVPTEDGELVKGHNGQYIAANRVTLVLDGPLADMFPFYHRPARHLVKFTIRGFHPN
ncbi:hypothetical protein HDV00_009792, partial [Rhizophlyctis rosea]